MSVVAVALLMVTGVLALLSVDLMQVLAAKERAQTAADAAALAAAQEMAVPSQTPPADLAARYAAANGATLESCDCDVGGSEAVVTVARSVTLRFIGGTRTLRASARAVIGGGQSGGSTPSDSLASCRGGQCGDLYSLTGLWNPEYGPRCWCCAMRLTCPS